MKANHPVAAGCGLACRPFGGQRVNRSNFVAAEPPGTEDHRQWGRYTPEKVGPRGGIMTLARLALSAVILLSSLTRSAEPASTGTITIEATGYGPFRVGMKPAEVATATATPLQLDLPFWEPNECFMIRPANGPVGLRIMVTEGTIARVEVDRKGIYTNEGANVGISEVELKKLYGDKLKWSQNLYQDHGHYAELLTDSRHAIVFETDGNKVIL